MERYVLNFIFLTCILRSSVCNVSQACESYDTIVVGLGSAGTTAASTLAKAGKRVLALEAQDRIGGRIMTVPFGNGVVELGAEWIHGTEHSRVYEIALRNNISIFAQDTSFKVYKFDGTEGNKELIEELVGFCLDNVGHPPDEPEQLGNFLTKKLMDYLKEKHPEILNDHDFINEFRDLMNFIINSYQASNDWNDVTAQTDYEALEGNQEMSWHRYGYKTFLELLLNTYNNGTGWPSLEIKLNKEVTLIKWPKMSSGNVEVQCKDGSLYTANNVIITVSLGVLKERYSSLFSPPLPDKKITIIDKLSIGVVGKTIFSFEQAWWPDVTGFILFWSHEDREAYKDDPWVVQLKSVATPMGSNNTLTFWANGDTAKLIETLPEDIVKSKMMELLKTFIGKNMTVPEPTGMIRSKWYSNPFTRGSYTYDNLLKHNYPNARAILGESLFDATGSPKVLFAGEATELTHFSTVHGASESGYREATKLLQINTEV